MSESASPESGALSVDQAIEALASPAPEPEENDAPEAPVEAAEEQDETDGADQPAEEPEDDAETVAEGDDDTEAEAVEPVEPPVYWSKEAKADFAKLPAELQAVVLAQEGPREEAAAKAKAEAAKAVEAAQKEVAGVQALATQLADFLPQAVKTFQQRWGEPDWAQVAQEHGAEQAFVLKAQFETEQKQLAQLAQAEQTAQQEAHKAFVQTEWKALSTLDPVLAPDPADPTKGADVRQRVTKFLAEKGIPSDAITRISAVEMSLAHDAMRWREAQAALKAPKPPKPAPVAQQRAAARPAAAQAQASPQRTATQVANRFAQTRSVDDAVALLLARKA